MTSDDIKRLYFYEKQFLRTQDFQDEQAYHIEMRRRHNIAHHTWGIVVGLNIIQDPTSKVWSVQPGMAVDAFGREIIVFDPEPLKTETVAAQLAGMSKPVQLNIWVAYNVEKLDRPAPGYEVCGIEDQFTRVRETFRLIYQDDPPIDLQEVPSSEERSPDNPHTWLRAYQNLSDDPGQARWPVYLGTLTWDTDPNNPSQNTITNVVFEDSRSKKKCHYVGVVAETIEVPNIKVPDNSTPDKFKLLNNTLFIRGRANSRPLPTDPNKFDYNGVLVDIEGKLEVERNLNVLGKAGIGIGTAEPDTKLQVSGGTDATLDNGTGHVVIGSVSSKNMVLDDHGIMARNNKIKAELQIQSKGGDLVIHKDQAGSELVVQDSGNMGIGTTTPQNKLDVGGGVAIGATYAGTNTAPGNGLLVEGNVGIGTTGPAGKIDIDESRAISGSRLKIGHTVAGHAHHITSFRDLVLNSNDGIYIRHNPTAGDPTSIVELVRITPSGNVGIGAINPSAKLDVVGRIKSTMGRVQFSRYGDWSTSSTTWVDTDVNVNIRTTGGHLLLLFNTQAITNTAGELIGLRFTIDGISVTGAPMGNAVVQNPPNTTTYQQTPAMMWLASNVPAGDHDIRVQVKVSSGTGYIGEASGSEGTERTLIVIEL